MDLKTLGYSCEGIHGIWERESCEKKAYWAHKFIVNLHFDVSAKKKKMHEICHVNGIIESGSERMMVLLYPQLIEHISHHISEVTC